MGVISDRAEREAARRALASRDPEDVRKAVEDHDLAVEEAIEAAEAEHGEDLPEDVRKAILEDPEGYLAEDE